MDLAVGNILTGKVTGITKFGAFVSLAPGKSGLVHISEIANTFVNDVSEFLSVGQDVTVKIIGIDQNGRINLSIKAALPSQERPAAPRSTESRERVPQQAPKKTVTPRPRPDIFGEPVQTSNDPAFEDKLKKFMQLSDSKIADARQYSERGGGRRRRGK